MSFVRRELNVYIQINLFITDTVGSEFNGKLVPSWITEHFAAHRHREGNRSCRDFKHSSDTDAVFMCVHSQLQRIQEFLLVSLKTMFSN